PTHVGLNRTTGVVYVLNTEADSVTLVDGRALRVLATLPVGRYPIGVAIDDVAGRAYIVNNRANSLSVVGEAPPTVTATRRLPTNVSSAALSPGADVLYLGLKSRGQVGIVRVADLRPPGTP